MTRALPLDAQWKRATHRQIVDAKDGHLVCEVFSGGLGNEGADEAEHLIAAAPELLRGLASACGALQAVPALLRQLGRPTTAATLEEILQPLLELLVRAAPDRQGSSVAEADSRSLQEQAR